MAGKRVPFPKMECVGYADPIFSHENKSGMSFSEHFCEGCGVSKTIPDIYAPSPPGPPMFFGLGKNGDGCGCTKLKELTNYFDVCQKCSGPIYLTPGAAMFRKTQGESYKPHEYCADCLDAVVFSGPCRNSGCKSIGGTNEVEATFRDQLFYETRQFTFPPNNCSTCRKAIKLFKKRKEIRPVCTLCVKPFRVTDGVMIMMLKNESKCETPKVCVRCRALGPDERRRLEQERLITELEAKRRSEIGRLFAKDKAETEREKQRRSDANRQRETKVRELIQSLNRLKSKPELRNTLHSALSDGILIGVLDDPKHPNFSVIHDALAQVFGGKGNMTLNEFNALPQAARLVFEKYPKAYGLLDAVPKDRGKGSSALHQHYELLSAAALMTTSAKSTSGKSLAINALRDKVDFGVKFPRETGIFGPKSKTIEADYLVWQPPLPLSLEPGRNIAIDSKHTTHKKYEHIRTEQLKGIRQGFNLDKFQDFYFVTNKEFGNGFVMEVKLTNLQLVSDHFTQNEKPIPPELSDLKEFIDRKYSSAKDNHVEINRFLERCGKQVENFVSKNDVPQIEMCEYVTFPGT